ncbi:ankyrin repeat domain-containing protein SOWAHB-like [Megalops cyprinoides]|uniref:ankyrin repeat domain-containing protein SOWAHB-like n=1 Tax=Megalops cyprinoides TaxID=118141 RepID=UPI0018652066|nr:ankyrin repeat domain-containing protein SOWAHB-like [Megalops cyprinoides]
MATEFSQDAVLKFICSNNGRVKNADLLTHFRPFLRDDENRTQNRDLFKRFVNTVAVVKQEGGVSFVVLKKRYMGLVRDVGAAPSPKTLCERTEKPRPKEVSRPESSHRKREKGQADSQPDLKVKGKTSSHVDRLNTVQSSDKVLPAAGIVNNNSLNVNFDNNSKNLPPYTSNQTALQESTSSLPCTLKPSHLNLQSEESNGSGESYQQVLAHSSEREAVFHPSQRPALTGGANDNICELRQSDEPYRQNKALCLSPDDPCNKNKVIVPEDVHESNVPRKLSHESQQKVSDSASAVRPLYTSQGSAARMSTSTPCLLACSESPTPLPDYQLITRSNGSLPGPKDGPGFEPKVDGGEAAPFSPQPLRHSLPLENTRSHAATRATECHQAGLSVSHGDLLTPAREDAAWPRGAPREEWASDEGLNYRGLSSECGDKVQEMLHRAQEAKMLSLLHRAERNVTPLHHSMGDLDSQDPGAARTGSGSATPVPLRHGARRTCSRLRSRMCRSLGADLDQPFYDDAVSARLNRLQLLSSSLSIHYPLSLPSRTHSYRDVSSLDIPGGQSHPPGEGHYFPRSSMVPLEPKEHSWLVKAAAGTWPEIYALFREEPSLLDKRDFISGYTVLHWIAKHGDHRVLNTLWYGVSKLGMKLDVDAKTTCGYTPLHLAAIHGHKKLIRLLVHKFKANVALRDTSGKKPWQYVSKGGPRDILQLLGAPLRVTGGGAALQQAPSEEKLTARPVTMSPTVKRQSSIAAFLKHKSLLRVPAHSESFV